MSDDVVHAVRTRFDGRAPTYDSSAMHRDLAVAVAAFVDLTDVTTVLDVATGTGLVLDALRTPEAPDAGASARTQERTLRRIGVDVSVGMLAVARDRLPDAELVEADARRLPLADGSVDLVTCVTGLHLIPDTALVLDEWVRVLRPGGRVVTATFAEFDPTQHHREVAGTDPAPYPLRHDPFRTPEALSATVAPHGLHLLRHAHWTDGHDRLLLAELARIHP
ncbi:MAG TPA: methyltransferase domain-containing protein [Cellulomonas sp.]